MIELINDVEYGYSPAYGSTKLDSSEINTPVYNVLDANGKLLFQVYLDLEIHYTEDIDSYKKFFVHCSPSVLFGESIKNFSSSNVFEDCIRYNNKVSKLTPYFNDFFVSKSLFIYVKIEVVKFYNNVLLDMINEYMEGKQYTVEHI